MKTRYQRRLTMLFVFVTITGCISQNIELPRPPQPWLSDARVLSEPRVVDSGALSIAVAPTKKQYQLGEPVYLRLTVTNRSEKTALVYPFLEPGEGAVQIEIEPPDQKGSVLKFVPLGVSDNDAEVVPLGPGESLGTAFAVFFGGNGWTFTQPGTWRIRAIYENRGNGDLFGSVSASVDISNAQAAAGRFLIEPSAASWEAGKFLTWQAGDHLRKGQAHLLNLMDRYPDGTLTHYVNFAIGKSLSQDFLDYSVNRRRPPDCSRAAYHLDRIDLSVLPDNLLIQWHLAKARCAVLEGDRANLETELRLVREIIVSRVEYKSLLGQVERLEKTQRQ